MRETTFNKILESRRNAEKSNYEILKEYAKDFGYLYETVDSIKINKLSFSQINKIKNAIENGEYTDLKIRLEGTYYMLEITPMKDIRELDIVWNTLEDYKKSRGK